MFQHTESARKHAKKLIVTGLSVLIVALGLLVLSTSQGKDSLLLSFILGLCALPGLLMTITALMQFKRGGEWNITVDEQKVIWSTPDYLGESFEYTIEQISHIENIQREEKISPSVKVDSHKKNKYFLVTKDQQRHHLKKQSSVDLDRFVNALVKVGVEVRVLTQA